MRQLNAVLYRIVGVKKNAKFALLLAPLLLKVFYYFPNSMLHFFNNLP